MYYYYIFFPQLSKPTHKFDEKFAGKKTNKHNIIHFASFQIYSKTKFRLRPTHSYCSDQKSTHTSTTMHLCLNANDRTVRIIIAPTIVHSNARQDWCWDLVQTRQIENSNNSKITIIRHGTTKSVNFPLVFTWNFYHKISPIANVFVFNFVSRRSGRSGYAQGENILQTLH